MNLKLTQVGLGHAHANKGYEPADKSQQESHKEYWVTEHDSHAIRNVRNVSEGSSKVLVDDSVRFRLRASGLVVPSL